MWPLLVAACATSLQGLVENFLRCLVGQALQDEVQTWTEQGQVPWHLQFLDGQSVLYTLTLDLCENIWEWDLR